MILQENVHQAQAEETVMSNTMIAAATELLIATKSVMAMQKNVVL